MVNHDQLHGVHVALATPIGADGAFDAAALDKLLDRVISGGVMGVCPTGSTGEGPRLTRAQRRDIARRVRTALGTDRLVIPAGSAMTVSDAVSEIDDLAEAGADAVLLAPPSYYPMAADGIGAWYAAVAADAALPIVLYNIPPMTKISIPAATVAELAGMAEIIGIKDSSRDFEYLQSVCYATADEEFAVLTGSDTMLLPSMLVGAVGAIAASANLVPELGLAVYRATVEGDLERARQCQQELYRVVMACRVGTPPAGWKAALAWAGVCSADPVLPIPALDDAARQALGSRLELLGVGRS